MQLARECAWLRVFYSNSFRTHLRPTMKNNLLEKKNTNNNVYNGDEVGINVSEGNKMCFFSTDVR